MKRTHLVLVATLVTSMAGASVLAASPRGPALALETPSAAELGLDPSHAAAWERLRAESLQLRTSARQDMRERLSQADDILASDAPDLRALSADVDRRLDEYLARSRDLRARKLAFYESLSPAEQASVRDMLRARLDRMQRVRSALAALFFDAR